jgi:DNA-binding MarR family transcriptional regulator
MLPFDHKHDPMPPEDWAFYGMVWVSGRLMSLVGQRMEEAHRLPLTWFEVLLWLQHADGALSVSDLGQFAMLSRSQVSRVLDSLQARGLVTRSPSTADGRSVEVTVTDSGRRLFKEGDHTRRQALADAFTDKLTDDDLADLGRIWRKLKS